VDELRGSGAGSGSGWVAVGPLERGGRGGSNGGRMAVAVAVLAKLRWCLKESKKPSDVDELRGSGAGSGSGWVAVVPFERGGRGGSNGGRMAVAVAVSSEISPDRRVAVAVNSGCKQWLWKRGARWDGEWQWLGGSGTIRKRRARRFEWYRLGGGSGCIGRVAVGFVKGGCCGSGFDF
jgi:hypothetical protein